MGSDAGLGSSEYLKQVHGLVQGSQEIDLTTEQKVQACVFKAIERGLLNSAHDCSDGGLAVTLAESCILGNIGFNGRISSRSRLDAALFGESQSRIVVSVRPRAEHRLETLASKMGVQLTRLGRTGGDRMIINGIIDLSVCELRKAWWDALG